MTHFLALDPGFSGGIAVINAPGTYVKAWKMPTKAAGKDGHYTQLDLDGLQAIFQKVRPLPGLTAALEFVTTRPEEPAERSFRFGKQTGQLEAFLFCHNIPYQQLSPVKWKGRLRLPGKFDDPRSEAAARLWDTLYPDRTTLIRGPRGGVLDGILDALLMAHFIRTESIDGIKSVLDTHGRGSVESARVLLQKGKRRPKFLANP